MYSDLFDQLGGRGAGGGGNRSSENNNTSSRAAQGPPPLVALKAGKLTLTPSSTTTESSSLSYRCVADPRRGEIRLVYQADAGGLTWQWYDRRDETVVDTYPLSTTTTSSYGSLDRVPLTGKRHERDRIYVWSRPQEEEPPETTTTNTTPAMDYDMYWMQDESTEQEDALIQELNSYLANPAKAAANNTNAPGTTSTTTTGSGAVATTSTGNAATSTTTTSNNTTNNNNSLQVDALSTILENLGMPQPTAGGTSNTAASGTGTLTLADLQGAMAQMQQQPPSSTSPPVAIPLTEVVTPAAITALLESDDPTVRQRLAALLPSSSEDGNNSSEQTLADNLRSPQVQQTLRSLTQALLPDDHGNVDGFLSVLANFQLNGNNNNNSNLTPQAMANPIQAFLDAIQESVQENTATTTAPAADTEGGESKEEDQQEEKSDDPMDEGN